MVVQEINKSAKCHVAESAPEPRIFDSRPSYRSSGPPGCPVVKEWCFLSWALGSQVCATRPHIGMATARGLRLAGPC